MKKKLAKLLAATLILTLTALSGATTAQAAQSKTLRVGLAYGSAAVASASLKNKVGAGFSLGYYDAQRQFVPLAWTDQTHVSVLITQNLYLTSGGGYSYSAGSYGAVGCYHVQLPGSYADFPSAQAAADTVENGFVAWMDGTYYVRAGSYTRKSAAEEAAAFEGATLGETSGYGYSVVPAGSTRILFQFDANAAGETGALGVQPMAGEGEKAETVYNGGLRYNGGFRFERINGGESTVVNMVDREDYLKGVLPYEMSTSWPLEALKAQAVCARTYANGTKHSDYHFDLCTTTECQVYKGVSGAGEASDRAVEETAGQMIYYQGKCVNTNAVYYSSNGGATEDAKNVWGIEHGFLKGKLDPYEEYAAQFMTASQLSYYRWTKTLTASALKTKMNADGYPCGEIVELRPKLSATGNVIALTVVDASEKTWTFDRERVRTYFGLNSIRFTVTTTGGGAQSGGYAIAGAANAADLSGLYALGGDGSVRALPSESYVITQNGVEALEPAAEQTGASEERVFTLNGSGWGHNVGLSQWGAYAMAKQGFGYQDILRFYYTDVTIE